MKFKLIEKTYKEERYEANPFQWKDCKIKPVVRMWYHTRLKYWDVAYKLNYGKGFVWTAIVKSKGMLNRRDARKFAREYMKGASKNDIEKLSDFYKKSILEKTKKKQSDIKLSPQEEWLLAGNYKIRNKPKKVRNLGTPITKSVKKPKSKTKTKRRRKKVSKSTTQKTLFGGF